MCERCSVVDNSLHSEGWVRHTWIDKLLMITYRWCNDTDLPCGRLSALDLTIYNSPTFT